MKKKYIQLGAAAFLLLCLAGALLLIQGTPEKTEEAPQAEKTYLTGAADGPTPARLDIQNESGSFAVINKAPEGGKSEPVIEDWENLSLDRYGLGAAISAAQALETKRVITDEPSTDELSAYGFQNPRATLIITPPGGGAKTEVLIGNIAPGGEGAYAKRGDQNAVYLINGTLADPFTKPASDYINKAVTEADTESKGFDRLIISGSHYPEPIVIERSPETAKEAGGMVFGTHRITAPLTAGVSMDGMEILSTLYGISAERVEAVGEDPATLQKYGLDAPEMTLDITGADEAHTMTLQAAAGDGGQVYLKKNGSPVIYALPGDSLTWFRVKLFDVMERMPLLPNIDTVSSVTVKTPLKTYVFNLTGEGDTLKAVYGETELDVKNFKQFYQTLVGARYTEEIPAAKASDPASAEPQNTESSGSEPENDNAAASLEALEQAPDSAPPTALLEIEYRYRGGGAPDTVSFYPGPVRKALMRANGGTAFYTTSAYVDRVLEDVQKVSAGDPVKSYL